MYILRIDDDYDRYFSSLEAAKSAFNEAVECGQEVVLYGLKSCQIEGELTLDPII